MQFKGGSSRYLAWFSLRCLDPGILGEVPTIAIINSAIFNILYSNLGTSTAQNCGLLVP